MSKELKEQYELYQKKQKDYYNFHDEFANFVKTRCLLIDDLVFDGGFYDGLVSIDIEIKDINNSFEKAHKTFNQAKKIFKEDIDLNFVLNMHCSGCEGCVSCFDFDDFEKKYERLKKIVKENKDAQ